MRTANLRIEATIIALLAAGGLVGIWHLTERATLRMGDPTVVTGWSLVGVFVLLASFNLRKKLSMLPIGRVRHWTLAHVVFGFAGIGAYLLHVPTIWPDGTYEQCLAVLVYVVNVSGIVGYVLQRAYPARLTQTGVEIIWERIPAIVADLRAQAEAVIEGYSAETGVDTLARHYLETLDWFFRRPRFLFSHAVGGHRAQFWTARQRDAVINHMSAAERPYFDKLFDLARQKNLVDIHYSLQGLMKVWLLVHLPAAVAMIVLAAWHVILVHVYGP